MNRDVAVEARVLAIDPNSRGLGFAVFEGPNNLVDWGVKEARSNKNARCLKQIGDLIARYEPDVLIVESCKAKGSRRCARVRHLISEAIRLASRKGVGTHRVSCRQVRAAFSQSGMSTKHQIATAIARQLPELAPRLPPFRRPWMSEDCRASIFDAVAFGLAFFYLESRRKTQGA